ncbi:MAG: efflux RND transporter periplasmic adaptor subunit, partial [Desulfovibrio desulfuricans]|nr:efflux RND transporter periplasmic adaptor subunit [Desulfovibrio desulfuricans]
MLIQRSFCRTSFPVASTLLVLVLFSTGCDGQSAASQKKITVVPEVAVETAAPQRILLTTELSGRTSTYEVAEVRPQVNGVLKKRLFTEGTEVKAGQPLYQIDPAPYEAAYQSARAALVKAEANITPARLRAERFRQLLSSKAVSKQEYDDALAAYKQAQADVDVNKAAVENARIQLDYTTVLSPISGHTGKSLVTPGALVTANQTGVLVSVRQLDPIYVDVTQSSLELLQLRRNIANGLISSGIDRAAVKLKLENGALYPLEGQLQFTDLSVDESTGMVTLRAIFPNPDHILLPGMYVRAIINEGGQDNALMISQKTLAREPSGQAFVYVVTPNNTVKKCPVTLGRMVGDKWQVLTGMTPGDHVVVEGLQNIRPGMSVIVRKQ